MIGRSHRRRSPPALRAVVPVLLLLAVATLATGVVRLGGAARDPAPADAGDPLDDPSDAAGDALRAAAEGVPVLCYHYFRSGFDAGYTARVLGAVILNLPTLGPRDFWTIPIGEFERHLRLLRERGVQVLTLPEIAAAAAGRPLPRPAVVLTIDDADESVYKLAWPALQRHGVRAHLFVPTAQVGRAWGGLRICTWSQLREMSDSGAILVESHTHDLHWKVREDGGWQPAFLFPRRLPPDALPGDPDADPWPDYLPRHYAPVARDLRESRRLIVTRMGRPSLYLAWPYGFATAALDSIAAIAGFAGTVSLKPYPWRRDDPSWHIGRYAVTAATTPARLFEYVPSDPMAARDEP